MCTCAKDLEKKIGVLCRLPGKFANIENGRFYGVFKVKTKGTGRAYHKSYRVPFECCPLCGERYPSAQKSLFDQIRANTKVVPSFENKTIKR